MPHRIRIALVPVLVLIALPAFAATWEEPASWRTVGEVVAWKNLDRLFFRLRDDELFLDRSADRIDQRAAYRTTLRYGADRDAVGLAAWQELAPDEQQRRRRRAASELEFVANFRLRIETQAQRTRENRPSGWGLQVQDLTAVGDCLQHLRTAVGLDPSNPYAWHLYGWLALAVGDRDRAGRALDAAQAALGLLPDGALPGVRRGVALDRTWLAWELGDMDEAAARLDDAGRLGADVFQVTLLRGLIAARQGDVELAFRNADRLRSVAVRRFPMNFRTTGPAPETFNVAVWEAVPSDYAERWIKALAWIGQGRLEMAAKAFGAYRLDDIYPQGHRFWNDAGYVYELTGRPEMAAKAWDQARITTPFAPYFPYMPHETDLGGLIGRLEPSPYYLGFDRFFLAGSLLARAEALVEEVERAAPGEAREAAAAAALAALDVCTGRGHYAAQAALLKGAVYHAVGDVTSAVIEVEEALDRLEAQGDGAGAKAILAQLTAAGADRGEEGVRAFYGQSGAADGRWARPADPEQRGTELRDAYAADPGDANRRALARFMIRHGDVVEGRALVAGRRTVPDLVLALEADRALGRSELAVDLAERLATTGEDPWNDAELWTLAGFACLDAGRAELGRAALERALELDPGNRGLRVQLEHMGGGGG